MADHRSLADPEFEPTDADLIGLSERAPGFARYTTRLSKKLREQISVARERALLDVTRRLARAAER